jgi:hypothetical protein
MKFWIKTIEEAIELFNSPTLYKENDNIESKLNADEEEFIIENHKSILKNNKIECFCWKPDQGGYVRYDIKNTKYGLIKLFKDSVEIFDIN